MTPEQSAVIWIVVNHQGPIQAFRDRADADAFLEQLAPLGVPVQIFSCALVAATKGGSLMSERTRFSEFSDEELNVFAQALDAAAQEAAIDDRQAGAALADELSRELKSRILEVQQIYDRGPREPDSWGAARQGRSRMTLLSR